MALFLQFLISTAGVSLLVALSRGLGTLLSERGARRSVTAAKETQDLLARIPEDDPRYEILQMHRDQELIRVGEAVRRASERKVLAPRVGGALRYVTDVALAVVAVGSGWAASDVNHLRDQAYGTPDEVSARIQGLIVTSVVAGLAFVVSTVIRLLWHRRAKTPEHLALSRLRAALDE